MYPFATKYTAPVTMHLAVSYLDRLLSTCNVSKNRMQLVCLACMLIAGKFEEAEEVVPTLDEYKDACNGAFPIKDIKEMEVGCVRVLFVCKIVDACFVLFVN